ncbi:MAG: hypothetical protein ACKVU4_01160 [Phycisphaerales bacterium]
MFRRPVLSSKVLPLVVAVLGLGGSVSGQAHRAPRVVNGPGDPLSLRTVAVDPDAPASRALAATNKRRVELEREMYKIRATYFRNIRNVEVRQVGLSKLSAYSDPAIFPSLLKIFGKEKDDVRTTILDNLAGLKTEHADATIAWGAIFGADAGFRAAATERLMRRMQAAPGEPSIYVQSVIARGLRSETNAEITSAARLAEALRLYEAIPMLINAQISGQTTRVGGGGGGDTSLAYILVGQQQAFISDLTPVVGDTAVAFDPTVGVVTEGVILRVLDAVVVTYRVEVNTALRGLASAGWGRPVDQLGWNVPAWHEWYANEFKPHLAKLREQERADAGKGEADASLPATTPAGPAPGGG